MWVSLAETGLLGQSWTSFTYQKELLVLRGRGSQNQTESSLQAQAGKALSEMSQAIIYR